jgi:two-component system, cell cycle sensor histidine kinase and response regulator CckA
VLHGAVTQQSDGSWDEEYRIVRPDGDVRWIRDTAYPVQGHDGLVERIVGVARDITERKLAQLQFLQAQKLEVVGLLAGGVAHDFNNLLTVILGESQLLEAELGDASPFVDAVREIRRAGERAAGLTRQLLAFSRRQIVEPSVFPVNDVIAEMGSMLRRLLGERVELVIELEPAAGAVRADRGQIEQVVMNLAVNARDAMPNGGHLTLRSGHLQLYDTRSGLAAGPYVLLEAQDTGTGMSDEVRAKLFEPFFTTKEPGKGTGLGLSTSRGIVRQAGGEIEVESRPLGGTTMRVLLPRVTHARAAGGTGPSRALPRGTETVLVVEDDAVVRDLVSRMLRPLGYEVLAAPDGTAAIKVATAHPGTIHLLLTDVVMPGMNGREVAEAVARIRPGIKTLYTTGYSDDTMLQIQLLDQQARVVTKPYAIDALTRRVREALDG